MTVIPARRGTGESTQGPPGADGESAYELWIDQGNSGTISDFLASLRGAQGVPGPAGEDGTGTGGTSLPRHPLDYPVVSTKPAGFANAPLTHLSDGTVRTSLKRRVDRMPCDVHRLGVVYMNADHGFGFTDTAAPNSVDLRCAVGPATNGVIATRARPWKHLFFEGSELRERWADGDQIDAILPPGEVVIFDTGRSFSADALVAISTYALVNSGEKFLLHSLPNDTAAKDAGTLSTSTTDNSLAAFGGWSGNGTQGFDYLALVDLDGPGGPALLVLGDSLMAGNSYGGALGLRQAGRAYVSTARSGEQLQQVYSDLDSKSTYRRAIESRLRFTAALMQGLTNDADLTNQSMSVWQGIADEVCLFLKRRGITTLGWATLPPHTLSVDGWATTAGQYLDMTTANKSRGYHQQLMQDWNASLRSGTLLFTDNTLGLKLYAPPAARSFWTGGCAIDWWLKQTVMEPVNTGVTAGAPNANAGYDFGGQPIMKWAVGVTTDGLHDGGNPNLRAPAVAAVVDHLLGITPLY